MPFVHILVLPSSPLLIPQLVFVINATRILVLFSHARHFHILTLSYEPYWPREKAK